MTENMQLTVENLASGLTRTEGIALVALMEHIGLPLQEAPTPKLSNGNGKTRHWTRAMRAEASRRAKAYWRAKRRQGK